MRESHCLDTDLNLMSDLAETRRSISVRRSTLVAIISAAGEDVLHCLLFFDIFFFFERESELVMA